jgi:hypothetical protein
MLDARGEQSDRSSDDPVMADDLAARRPMCIFWLHSAVPRYSEFQTLPLHPDAAARPQRAPRVLWRCLARGSLALIAEQLVEGEMVMVEGTLLGDLGPAKGRKAAAVAGHTPRYEVLAAAVRFDALARSRNADVGDIGLAAEEETVGGLAAPGLEVAAPESHLGDEAGTVPPGQPPEQPVKKKRPARKKKGKDSTLAAEERSDGDARDAAAAAARPKRKSRRKKGAATAGEEDDLAVEM